MENFRSNKIDITRGFAILAMIFYHFCWDLGEFGVLDSEMVNSGGWRLFAQLIGSSFLFISGLSFWLFFQFSRDRKSFFNRVVKLILASLFVSIGTFFAYGDYFVFFGILHLLTVCSLIGIIFCRLPSVVLIILTIFVVVAANYISLESFSSRFLAWTGLYGGYIGTLDFYPFFPWAGPYILGVAFGKLIYGKNLDANRKVLIRSDSINEASILNLKFIQYSKKVLIFLSSYSLYIYLVHQPILFGIIIFALNFI